MCGIFGFTGQYETPERLLSAMGDLQRHRGPDGQGFYIDQEIAIGMRRLSIIDIEHGNQPFFNPNRTVAVFCNGEIYNYRELREELRADGCVFHTDSDVEVLPHLYDRYGMEFVHRLNGMYAIALYDRSSKRLCLVRDRLGIKPLYYSQQRGQLAFSSELKSLFALGTIDKTLDFNAISTYLELMYVPTPLTPFTQVRKLEAGSFLVWEQGHSRLKQYWSPRLPQQADLDEQQALEQMDELLHDSIRLELRSDVPVGAFLSGGVDSSLVTALAAQATPSQFTTFHMRWKEVSGKTDESRYARMVSERYATRDCTRDVAEIDLPALLPRLAWHLDEPFGDAAFVPTYLLSKIAAESVKVILSGAGGDELFGGYPHHGNRPILKSLLTLLRDGRNPAYSYFDIWNRPYSNRWERLFPWFSQKTFKEAFERDFISNRDRDRQNALMLADNRYYLQDNILMLTDKMTMAASLECRVPLLDHRLQELSLQIPSALKIHQGEYKYLLKKYAEAHVPREALYREKEGFGSPVWLWVNRYKELYFDRLLDNGFLEQNGLINRAGLRPLLLAIKLSPKECWRYWQILMLEIWCRLFLDDAAPDSVFELT